MNFDEYKEAIYWSLPPEQYNTPILMISSIPVWIEKNCLSIDIKFTGMDLCVLCFSIINKVIDQAKCLTVTGAEIHITCTWLYNDGFGTCIVKPIIINDIEREIEAFYNINDIVAVYE